MIGWLEIPAGLRAELKALDLSPAPARQKQAVIL
jgi:hypothetical protein